MNKQYAERDILGQDRAGNYYSRHVHAMTAEGLHDKSDIAAELAHRDIQIDRLRKLVRYAITDYIQPEIRAEEEAFRGHEHCSNLAGLRLDLAEFQAAANGANTEAKPTRESGSA